MSETKRAEYAAAIATSTLKRLRTIRRSAESHLNYVSTYDGLRGKGSRRSDEAVVRRAREDLAAIDTAIAALEEHAALVAAVRAAAAYEEAFRRSLDTITAAEFSERMRAFREALASELVQRAIARGT